jgi:hypothetical protein
LCPLIALFVYVISLGTPLRLLTAMYLSMRRDFLRNNVTQRGNGNGEGKSGKANSRKEKRKKVNNILPIPLWLGLWWKLQFPRDGIERMGRVRAERAGLNGSRQIVFKGRTLFDDLC